MVGLGFKVTENRGEPVLGEDRPWPHGRHLPFLPKGNTGSRFKQRPEYGP